MSKTTWIVQRPGRNVSPSMMALKRAIVDADYPLVEVGVVPFSDVLPDIPHEIEFPFVIYGMDTMIRTTSKHPKWKRGLFFDAARFEPVAYTKVLGDRMLNHDAQLATCEELAKSGLKPADRFFLRPNDDSKAFTGTVISFQEFQRWYRSGGHEQTELHPAMRVLYSTPKTILAEYRTFVLDGTVIASSQYLPHATALTPPEVLEFAADIARHYAPADAFVCDVASTPDGLKAIEFNCINGSNFYRANVDTIVRALSIWQER